MVLTLNLKNSKFLIPVFFSIFFISSFLLPSCNTANQAVTNVPPRPEERFEIYFENSEMLMPVLEKAKQEDKMVFMEFYADWCLPCKLMEEDVFTDKEIGRFFNENFLSMHVNGESQNGANLRSIFDIKAYPTLLWLDVEGNVVVKKEGAAFHTEIKELARQALAGGNQN